MVVDLSVGRHEGFGMAVAGCGALLGVMAGSLAVGFLSLATSEHGVIYWIMIALLALSLALVPAAPETVVRRAPLRTACKPVVSIDPKLRRAFPIAGCAYIASWGIGTFFQSFSSPVAVECFGAEDPFVASAILALSMAPSALGAPIEARMRSGVSLRVSMAALLAFTCGMCVSMAAGALVPFLVLVALFGLSTGMCLSGSLRLLFADADAGGTAAVVSTINLVGYAGSAMLSGVMGALVGITTLGGRARGAGLVRDGDDGRGVRPHAVGACERGRFRSGGIWRVLRCVRVSGGALNGAEGARGVAMPWYHFLRCMRSHGRAQRSALRMPMEGAPCR